MSDNKNKFTFQWQKGKNKSAAHYLTAVNMAIVFLVFISCSTKKQTSAENENATDSTALPVSAKQEILSTAEQSNNKGEAIVIQNSNITGTDWVLGEELDVAYNFKSDQSCSIKSMLDTAGAEYRKAFWKLSHDTLLIAEAGDTSFYKIIELTARYIGIRSMNKPNDTDDENYDQSREDYFSLYEGGDRFLWRDKIIFSTKVDTVFNPDTLIGYWHHSGFYSLADKSYEFNADGTYTYIEGPKSEEKYISLKRKGTWSIENNAIRLVWPGHDEEKYENLHIKKMTTSYVVFEEKQEVYLKFQPVY
jgi:hypothetical protein